MIIVLFVCRISPHHIEILHGLHDPIANGVRCAERRAYVENYS